VSWAPALIAPSDALPERDGKGDKQFFLAGIVVVNEGVRDVGEAGADPRTVIEFIGDAKLGAKLEYAAQILAIALGIAASGEHRRDDDVAVGEIRLDAAVAEDTAVRVAYDADRGTDEVELPSPAQLELRGG